MAIGLLVGIWQLLVVAGVQSGNRSGGEPLPGPGDALAEIGYLVHIGVSQSRRSSRHSNGRRSVTRWRSSWARSSGSRSCESRCSRAGVGSLLAGLQSLPSVVWVPFAVLFLGDFAVYFVVIMGAFPSIAMGLMSSYDNVPPLTFSLARSMGARGPQYYRHFIFSATLPGYVAGMKQAWAFSWRSLMAAELIIGSTASTGLGQILDNGRSLRRPS